MFRVGDRSAVHPFRHVDFRFRLRVKGEEDPAFFRDGDVAGRQVQIRHLLQHGCRHFGGRGSVFEMLTTTVAYPEEDDQQREE